MFDYLHHKCIFKALDYFFGGGDNIFFNIYNNKILYKYIMKYMKLPSGSGKMRQSEMNPSRLTSFSISVSLPTQLLSIHDTKVEKWVSVLLVVQCPLVN